MEWLDKLLDSKNPIVLLVTSRAIQLVTRLSTSGLTAVCVYVTHAPPTDEIAKHIGAAAAGAGAGMSFLLDIALHWIRTRRKEADAQKKIVKAAETGVVPPPTK